MTQQYEDHVALFEKKYEELNQLPISEELMTIVDDFLNNYHYCHIVQPFEIKLVEGRVNIMWTVEHACVSVFLGTDETWEWHALVDAHEMGKYGIHQRKFDYIGPPSFYIDKKDGTRQPYYVLPDEVDKMFKIRVEFSKDYNPVRYWQCPVEWVTGKYDGMLSGYCRYKNRLHYFDCIEETDIERHRMFAVYYLTRWQRMCAWYLHMIWIWSYGSKLLRKFIWWDWRKTFGFKSKAFVRIDPKDLYGDPVAFFTER